MDGPMDGQTDGTSYNKAAHHLSDVKYRWGEMDVDLDLFIVAMPLYLLLFSHFDKDDCTSSPCKNDFQTMNSKS